MKGDKSWVEGYSRSEMRREQLEDPVIGKVLRWVENGEKPNWESVACENTNIRRYWTIWDDLVILDSVLYYMTSNDHWRRIPALVLPAKLRNGALRQLHDVRVSGHLGSNKTFARVRERYFWVGYHQDVTKWVQSCSVCIQKSKPAPSRRAPMKIHLAGTQMERVAMDILGPLPISDKGNRYILCVGDTFTKWITSIPIPNQETKTIADALIEHVFSIFGLPKEILTDQGRNFESRLFAELCKLFEIKHSHTTPYKPSSNGFIENWNRSLGRMLKCFTGKNQKDWDTHIPYIMLAYRSSVHSTVGFTPNEMMLGWNVRLPADLIYGKADESENI